MPQFAPKTRPFILHVLPPVQLVVVFVSTTSRLWCREQHDLGAGTRYVITIRNRARASAVWIFCQPTAAGPTFVVPLQRKLIQIMRCLTSHTCRRFSPSRIGPLGTVVEVIGSGSIVIDATSEETRVPIFVRYNTSSNWTSGTLYYGAWSRPLSGNIYNR